MTPFAITFFHHSSARFKTEETFTLEQLAEKIEAASALRKEDLPWLKAARFGDFKSAKGSLRNDDNVRTLTGITSDYDEQKISFDAANELLIKNDVQALLYTSPSHRDDAPRWRVLCPFSRELAPAEHTHMVARLNGIFKGALAPESFTLSQSYYYGSIPDHNVRVRIIDGTAIDLLDELDRSAIGKNGRAKFDGDSGPTAHEFTETDELIRRILSGEALHTSVTSIAGRYARQQWPIETCVELIGSAFTSAHQLRYGGRWDECITAIHDIYGKERSKQQQEAPPPEQCFTAAWLQSQVFPEVRTVVASVLVEGLTLFAGKPKIGKSWLMLHAAIAVAQFGKTLGDLTCDGGDVLYCALEDTPRRLQDRIGKLGCGWPARLHLRTTMPRLAMGGLKVITDWLDSVKDPRLVIIDTLELVRERPKNGDTSYASDYAAALQLRALANARQLAIVVVHHLRKAEAEDPFDTVSGTLGLTGAPDAILILTRDGPGATTTCTLRGKGRDLEELERPIVFDRTTCLWTITGATPATGDPWQKKKTLRVFKRALDNAILDHGETIKPWPTNPPVRAVKEFALRAAFYKEDPAPGAEGDKREAHRKNFKRAVEAALGDSLIATQEIDGIVFLWPVA
jgi:hypothetical protein